MADKAKLLRILSGTVCSVCGQPKAEYNWTCSDCYRPYQEHPVHRRLSDVCDDHMRAADAFLELAAVRPQKPGK